MIQFGKIQQFTPIQSTQTAESLDVSLTTLHHFLEVTKSDNKLSVRLTKTPTCIHDRLQNLVPTETPWIGMTLALHLAHPKHRAQYAQIHTPHLRLWIQTNLFQP